MDEKETEMRASQMERCDEMSLMEARIINTSKRKEQQQLCTLFIACDICEFALLMITNIR